VFDRLAGHFGEAKVFRDVDSIGYGEDFVERINVTVGSCDALIAIIGKQWLEARDKAGRRRLDDPKDFVRLEIKAALDRRIPVIPVLVADASMPPEEELPADLAALGRRQALEISDKRFDYDVDELIRALEGGKRGRSSEGGKKRRTKALAGIVAAAGAVAAGFFGYRYIASQPPVELVTPQKTVARPERPVIREPVVVLPVIEEFAAKPASVKAGEAVTLTWKVKNASRVELKPVMAGLAPREGTAEDRPDRNRTYTLAATGTNGKVVTESISVSVLSASRPVEPTPGTGDSAAVPTKVLLRLAKVFVREDGSPGATDWRFDILVSGKRTMMLTRRSYADDRPEARTGVIPLGIDRVEAPLTIPPGGKIVVSVYGYRYESTQPAATGAYSFDPSVKGYRMEVKNQQNPRDGWFLFEFRVTPQ